MPEGKAAGVRCIQLDTENACRIFGDPRRPAVCASLAASADMCGTDRWQALHYLQALERMTC